MFSCSFSLILGVWRLVFSARLRLHKAFRRAWMAGTYGEIFGSRLRLKTLLLVVVGLGVYSFFSWRWFGVFPSLPRFFLIAQRVFLGIFHDFSVFVFCCIFSSQFFQFFAFLFSFGGMGDTGKFDRRWCYLFFFRESYMVVLRGMQMVT